MALKHRVPGELSRSPGRESHLPLLRQLLLISQLSFRPTRHSVGPQCADTSGVCAPCFGKLLGEGGEEGRVERAEKCVCVFVDKHILPYS